MEEDRCIELNALDTGSGPAALLLHGQPGRAADWSPVVSLLEDRMRVIVPDRLGYGRSGGAAAGFGDNAAAAVELLDRLELQTVVLAGHSWGGAAALTLAARYPQRVRALVLVGPLIPGAPPARIDRFFASRFPGLPATRLGFLAGGLALSVPLVRRAARVVLSHVPPERLAAIGTELRRRDVARSFHREQQAVVDELPTLGPLLASVHAPVCILCGARERISPPSRKRELARQLPDARCRVVAGAGHLLPWQRPRLIAEEIAAAGPRGGG